MPKTFMLCCIFLVQMNAKALAQNISLQKNNATIKEVLSDIRRQSGFNILYNPDAFNSSSPVNVSLQNATIEEAVKACLKGQPFSFEVSDKTIIIRSAAPASAAPASVLTITGTINDDTGKPLPGATITIKGTSRMAVSDANGNYKIEVPDQHAVLIFSYIGFESKEVTISNTNKIVVSLTPVNKGLNEVIVVGYGTQRKSDLTGSVAGIKQADIEKTKSISFMETMQGRMAGVQVTSNSGEPGGAVNVSIRGTNSFNSGTQPLYVIDGVQIDVNNGEAATSGFGNTALTNPLAGINPNDIASIEVLKDASATAIFGSRGANGVVLVTTKTGKTNTSVLEFDMYAGVAWNPHQIPLLGAQDYAAYRLAVGLPDDTYAVDTNGDGKYDKVKDMSGVPSHDWQREALRKAYTQNYSLSISGGNAKTNFLVSASYLNQQGLIVANKFERYTTLAKITHNATDRLKLGAIIDLSQSIGTGVASNGGNNVNAYNGIIQTIVGARPVNAPDPAQLASDPDAGIFSSPVDFAKLSYKKNPLSRVLADLSASFKILNGFTFDTHAGAIFTFSKNGEFYPNTVTWGYSTNGMALLNTSNSTNWYESSTFTYNKRFAKDHSLTALLGFEVNTYQIEGFRWQGQSFDVQNVNPLDNISTANVLPSPPSTSKERSVRISEFARLNYSYKDKYLLTATLRNDASSKLAEGHKSSLFPSVGLAWRASKENFLKSQKLISDLKLRGSFGLTGNERIPSYQSLATLSPVYYSTVNNSASLGYAPNTIANPALTWETTHTYDAGLDISIWNDRLTLTADVYVKQTKDLLLQADIPSQSGFMRQYQNLGQIDNRGLELALNANIITQRAFTWSSNFNISFNRNKVVSLGSVGYIPVTVYGGSISSNVGRVIKGQPIGTAFGYVFDGVYQLSDFVITSAGGAAIDPATITSSNLSTYTYKLKPGITSIGALTVKPGDMKFKDLNHDGVVNSSDAAIISNSNPKYYGGFTNNFTYKNFDLSILFNWSYGNQILNLGRFRLEQGQTGFANITREYWAGHWTPENQSGKYPALNSSQEKVLVSSYYTEDGSFLRLSNVTLGYNLQRSASLKKIGISGLRLYATGINLYTWTHYSGYDPEINSYSQLLPGVDNISYPRQRSIIIGANIKF